MFSQTMLNGHKAIWLENKYLRLAVLPEKGADVAQLIHQPSGVQFLMQTPQGLRPPGEQPPAEFLENYEGAWQELFPNCSGACRVGEIQFPMHGEVALRSWDYELLDQEILHLWVTCRSMPFRLERWMRLHGNVLEVMGQVTNLGIARQPFVWGQHIVLGGDFLEDGCRLEMPAKTIITPRAYEPATARLADEQCEDWPMALGRNGKQRLDLRHVPGPQVRSHDDAFITGFVTGHLEVTNPRLGLCYRQDWDAAVFPWVVLWMPYGGADEPPLTGTYGLGIEPWVWRGNLAEAIASGKAHWLEPGESLQTTWRICIDQT